MILPEGIHNFNNERKLRDEVEKLKNIESRMEELKDIIKSPNIATTTTPKAVISNRVSDVEYNDDFVEEELEDRFKEIPTMALKNELHEEKYKHPEIREFAIDVWNGSPGLKYWGYNESMLNE